MPRIRLKSHLASLSVLLLLGATPALAAHAPMRGLDLETSSPDPTGLQNKVGIAAVVNDEAITFSDIRNRMQLYLLGAPGAPPPEVRKKIEQQVLDRLIDEKLQMQEAKSLGIVVDDSQIDQGFAQVAGQNHLQPDVFKEKLAASGVKVATLTEQIRAEVGWSMVVRRKLRPQVNISESEIDNEMDRLARDKGKTEYSVAEIYLPIASDQSENLARNDANKIVAQLQAGASFSQVAKQFSQAPGAANGGDLGWVQQGQLEQPLDAAIAKMEPGQISPPVKSGKGYHILFLRDRRQSGGSATAAAAPAPQAPPAPQAAPAPAAPAKADDVLHLKQIVIPVAKTDPQPILNAKLNRAQSLKMEVTSCESMETKSKDFLTPGTGDLGKAASSTLPPSVRAAVQNLPDGTLSEPVRLDNGDIAVLMVCERDTGAPVAQEAQAPAPAPTPAPAPQPVAAAPLDKDNNASRDQVSSQMGLKRLNQLADRYLKDLRASAYIEIRI